jgi:hypothetical protein
MCFTGGKTSYPSEANNNDTHDGNCSALSAQRSTALFMGARNGGLLVRHSPQTYPHLPYHFPLLALCTSSSYRSLRPISCLSARLYDCVQNLSHFPERRSCPHLHRCGHGIISIAQLVRPSRHFATPNKGLLGSVHRRGSDASL